MIFVLGLKVAILSAHSAFVFSATSASGVVNEYLSRRSATSLIWKKEERDSRLVNLFGQSLYPGRVLLNIIMPIRPVFSDGELWPKGGYKINSVAATEIKSTAKQMCRKSDANAAKQMIYLLLLNRYHYKFYCLPICEGILNKTGEMNVRESVRIAIVEVFMRVRILKESRKVIYIYSDR